MCIKDLREQYVERVLGLKVEGQTMRSVYGTTAPAAWLREELCHVVWEDMHGTQCSDDKHWSRYSHSEAGVGYNSIGQHSGRSAWLA